MDNLIYLSGPISGTNDYIVRFARAETRLQYKWRVINPAAVGYVLPELDFETIMRIDTVLLLQCDAIYMMKGWEGSTGCQLEYDLAVDSGITIYYESEEQL